MGKKLYQITFQPQNKTIEVLENSTVLEAAIAKEMPLEGPCSGKGYCGKCYVRCFGELSPPSEQEQKVLGNKLLEGWRLACQARVRGQVRVELVEQQDFHTIQMGQAKIKYELIDPPLAKKLRGQESLLGIAIDIGTTSIVAALINLKNGTEEAAVSCLNPQTQYGGDVISRITFAQEHASNIDKLQKAVTKGINQLIDELCAKRKIKVNAICHLSIAANTTMLHLLTGTDPTSLAIAPYLPVFVDYQEKLAADLGINASPGAKVSLLPSISAFVGADITAGILALDFHHQQSPALFVDIGTNGEIVVHANGKLAATSAAAGPALEGMNIQYGCRAEAGAISGFKIDENMEVHMNSIGTATRKGICGSGLIDLVAEMVKFKIIDVTGKFTEPCDLPSRLGGRIVQYQGQKAFLVDQASGIVLTQQDIRQVQLAKAAIAAAIEVLFQRLEFPLAQVEKVYIAGAFGYHLRSEALKEIGLLPPNLGGEIEYVGNTAKEGAKLCLISRQALKEIQNLQQDIIPVELSTAPEFLDNYMNQMKFPELEARVD